LLREALARGPCLVAFSGGRDSSALLAVAVGLARREGWSLPIPLTLRFASAATDEADWQERVLRHLGLDDWVRLDCGAELDMVGPIAAEGLRRHGLLYPANAHLIMPMARAAAGGSILTGLGGDDVFGNWPSEDIASVLAGRRLPRARDLRRCLRLGAPRWLEAEIVRRREPLMVPWIVNEQRRRIALAVALEFASAPRTWAARMRWLAGWRLWRETMRSLATLASDAGATVSSPFLEPPFLEALAGAGGRWGWGSRTATMRGLFGDLLPDAVISRRSKAEFSAAQFTVHTKRFADEWSGEAGAAGELVDPDALRSAWRSEQPHFRSAMALQACWLAADSS
jgi:asparagine synthase (glutamine-hydrolysing)